MNTEPIQIQRKKLSPWKLAMVPVLMFGFGFALVPLYDVFCDLTGLNGKNYSVASSVDINPNALTKVVTLKLVADADSRDTWDFKPEKKSLDIQSGKMITTFYELTNLSDKAVTIQAIPSVAPGKWAEYLVKIECFCFTNQVIDANSTVRLPLQVTLSAKAPDEVNHLSLSYRIYQIET